VVCNFRNMLRYYWMYIIDPLPLQFFAFLLSCSDYKILEVHLLSPETLLHSCEDQFFVGVNHCVGIGTTDLNLHYDLTIDHLT
jgi:hypothetical protein